MNGYSSADLLEFLEYLGNKGLVNKSTAAARRSGCTKIFELVSPNGIDDVRTIDPDQYMERFANLSGSTYSPGTHKEYRSRLGRSIEDFLRFKENPANFKAAPSRESKRPRPSKQVVATSGKGPNDVIQKPTGPTYVQTPTATATIDFPIPVRAGVIVQINGLPVDLSKMEAEKIAKVISAMAQVNEE